MIEQISQTQGRFNGTWRDAAEVAEHVGNTNGKQYTLFNALRYNLITCCNEVTMARKRLIIEMGMGVDQHGQEPTVAAARAVHNAIAHNALPGVWEVAGLSDPDQMIVEVQVAVPYPEQVRESEVLAVLPFGRKSLTVESGGMVVQGRAIASFNDKNDEMLIAVAAVTVLVETE